MKKLLFKIFLFAVVILIPASAMAQVQVRINIPLPPPIIFPVPPGLVVIPHTDVYSVPDVDDDIFFYGGWWWRPWEGRWYRSRSYDRGWKHYKGYPPFHKKVPPGWRKNYHDRRWDGYEWDHRPVPHADVEKNWKSWKRNKHWERENNWGVRRDDRGRRDDDRRPGKPGRGQGRGHDRDYNDGPGRGPHGRDR